MPFPDLSCVHLRRALPEHGLAAGALGTVVGVWRPADPDTDYEIEFLTPDGRTTAVLTLSAEDLRPG
ncbi:MAG: DUF4926 domain-containing protein [Mycolicibacterium sp.]|nr:DUF4926 domain-containing protein [Mycolicibacterium sp.]